MSRSAARAGAAGVLLMLAACAANKSPGARATTQAPSSAADAAAPDASYDYHNLILAPFGTLLKDSPVPLHEVLLFHDDHAAPGDTDSRDCFAIDAQPPHFVGQEPEQFLMCFDHDRLSRIDVAVRLGADRAAAVVARLCGLWLAPAAPDDTLCEGTHAGVHFSARRLAPAAGEDSVSLSATLSAVPRDAAHAP